MSENKFADTSALGLFLVALSLLSFGLVGVLTFADSEFAGGMNAMLFPMAWYAAIIFLLIAIAQFMAGSKFMTVIFGFLAFAFAVFSKSADWGGALFADGAFLFFILIGVLFIIFALWTFLAKAGFMLMGILLMAGLAFIMFSLALNATVNLNDADMFWLLMGVFSFLGGILAIYLAIVDTTGLKLPVM
jgi:hypothetical protein